MSQTTLQRYILKFDKPSSYYGKYVGTTWRANGVILHPENNPLEAAQWTESEAAMRFALSHCDPTTIYCVEKKLYILKATVEPMDFDEDRRPHSRACGIKEHKHGRECSSDCPTCGGRQDFGSQPARGE